MQGRWANSPQPTAIPAVDPNGTVAFFINDPQRVNAGIRTDIYPGNSEPLDIAVRFNGDTDCYGWNNEAYFVPPPGKNPQWRLGSDVFLVKIIITSTGRQSEGVFRLINDGPNNAFRLERASPLEAARVS
jgi:hypothetical protein